MTYGRRPFLRQALFTPRLLVMSAVLIFLITMDWTVIVAATRTSKEEYAAGASSAWLPLFKEGLCVRVGVLY